MYFGGDRRYAQRSVWRIQIIYTYMKQVFIYRCLVLAASLTISCLATAQHQFTVPELTKLHTLSHADIKKSISEKGYKLEEEKTENNYEIAMFYVVTGAGDNEQVWSFRVSQHQTTKVIELAYGFMENKEAATVKQWLTKNGFKQAKKTTISDGRDVLKFTKDNKTIYLEEWEIGSETEKMYTLAINTKEYKE